LTRDDSFWVEQPLTIGQRIGSVLPVSPG
jgi:hypothetical protein